MNEILHANIFFVIASIATVIFCILICIILYQIIKIMSSIRSIIERIEAGSEMLANDVAHVRELVSSGGIFTKMFQFMMGGRGNKKRNKKNRSD